MTFADDGERAADDRGLLTPGHVGTAAETATGDVAFLQAMLDAEAALTRARAAVGLTPARAATAVTTAARAALFDARELALRARQGGNPVIPLAAELATAVAHLDAEAAGHVHQGATSQDILDTATMLVARRAREAILTDLAAAATALATLTTAHRDTPIPGRTLTQHAVPTTFGLKAAGWHSLVRDAHDRLAAVRLPAQLGGAAGTLAAFTAEAEARSTVPVATSGEDSDEDVGLRVLAAYSREVGLAEPLLPWHTLRTPVADLGSALAFVTGALGKVAADVLVLSRTEVAEVAEGTGGGSSAMPHKSNPVMATLIATAARQAPPLASILFSALSAEDERPAGAWHAEWQPLRDLLRLAGGAARNGADLVARLHVFPSRMRDHLALTGGRLTSERVAATLAPLLGARRAKELLTAASRTAAVDGSTLDQALADVVADTLDPVPPELGALIATDRIRDLTDPARSTGSAQALVDRALRSFGTESGTAHDHTSN